MPTIKKLYFSSGTAVTAPADLTSESSTVHVNEYADDAAYVTANGTAAAGDIYINSTLKNLRLYTGSAWRSVIMSNDDADSTKLFVVDVDGATTGTVATLDFNQTASRTYTFPDTAGTVGILPVSLSASVTGTLPVANGGSGQTTANAALNAFLPTQSGNSGKFLKTDGTNSSWDTAGSGSGNSGPDSAFNYGLTASVGASALTIALKNASGSDASVGDPVTIAMRNATAATGSYNLRTVTGALSITVTSGATLGHFDATADNIYVYVIDNSGTLEIAVSSKLYADQTIITTTAMSSSADARNIVYSTTARTSVPLHLIGTLVSTQTTAGTWAAGPSTISLGTKVEPFLGTSQVVAWSGNGVGSTNTAIFQFTQSSTVGSGITYANNGTSGTSFTINESGVYAISYIDYAGASDIFVGISLNSSQLTTSIDGITIADCLAALRVKSTNNSGTAVATARLVAGDVIRPHVLAGATNHLGGVNNYQQFRITQLVKF